MEIAFTKHVTDKFRTKEAKRPRFSQPRKEDMKIKYYKEDDILVLQLRNGSYDHAEMEGNFVVHFSRDKKPVRIEVLNAIKFLHHATIVFK